MDTSKERKQVSSMVSIMIRLSIEYGGCKMHSCSFEGNELCSSQPFVQQVELSIKTGPTLCSLG